MQQVDGEPAQDSMATHSTSQDGAAHEIALLREQLSSSRKQVEYLEGQVEDLKDRADDLRSERDAWRGLFGGGKAE